MTAAGQAYAGSRLTAAMLQGIAPLSAYKGTSQPLASNATLQNDSALAIPLQANAVYSFLLILGYNGASGAGNLKFGWALPSLSSMGYSLYGNTTGGSATDGPWETASSVPALGTSGTGTNLGAVAQGTVSTGSTQGPMQLQWAQNTSNTTATTVLAGSVLLAWQVQ
jgi:hypothetical protein